MPRFVRWIAWGAGGLLALALIATIALWVSLPDVSALAKKNPETTAFIELRKAQAKDAGKKLNLRWSWRSLKKISPYLRNAVVHAEDARFWQHEGIDWDAVEEAAERNWDEGEMSVGGSTITQQLAKNLYLSPSRSLVRKVREALIAQRLEAALDKSRILELYLNVAEWGDGIFGAEAAARAWYGCSAAELTPAQAARLATALPNPFKRHPKARSRVLVRKAERLIRAMKRDRLLDDAAAEEAIASLRGS